MILRNNSPLVDYPGHFVQGSVQAADSRPIESHRLFNRFASPAARLSSGFEVNAAAEESDNFRNRVDLSWLPAAAETYDISADPSDYVMVDIPIVTAHYPNKNMQGFTADELLYFDYLMGRQTYKTFIGSGCHYEHNNKEPLKAKGVIFDAVIIPVPRYDTFKVSILAGFDRTKDRDLVNQILSGERNGYSMGCIVKNFICSVTGAVVTPDGKNDQYKRGQMVNINGKLHLVYHLCTGSNFFEVSSVANPADVTALGDNVGILGASA